MLKTFKINKTVSPEWPKGAVVQLMCDTNGFPEVPFWRDRYCDSKTDNCMSEIKPIARPDIKKDIETKIEVKKPKKVGRPKRTTNKK